MKITDNRRTVDIRMCRWTGNGYSPDWSNDYFNAGNLPMVDGDNVYIVDDVADYIASAQEWQRGEDDATLDYYGHDFQRSEEDKVEFQQDVENRAVFVEDI